MLYKARNNVITFFDDYSLMVLEALKISTPKQMITNGSCTSKSK